MSVSATSNARPEDRHDDRRRRATVATGAAIAALAVLSALQMVLFLRKFGTTSGTDGTLAAYSVYVLITVFAQGCRISGAAALGARPARITETGLAWTLTTAGVLFGLLIFLLRAPAAAVLTGVDGGIPFDRAEETLAVLSVGIAAQFAAAAWATILGHRDRLVWAAGSLAAGGVAAFVAFVLLLGPTDEVALAWATVASGIVACAAMAGAGLPRLRRPSRLLATGWLLARDNLVPLFATIIYVLSIGVAARSADQQGALTLFSLAFLACSYLTGVTSTSVAIVESSGTSRSDRGLADRLAESVPVGIRGAGLVAVLGLAGAVVAAPPIIELLAPEQLDGAPPEDLRLYLALLAPLVLAVVTSNVAFPSWAVLGRAPQLNRAILPLLVLHVGASLAAGAAFGVPGVCAATAIATVVFAYVCVRPADGLGTETLRAFAALVLRALLCFGPASALAHAALPSVPAWLAAAAVGTVLYVWSARRFPPAGSSALTVAQ